MKRITVNNNISLSIADILLSLFFCAPAHLLSMSSSQTTNPIREALKHKPTKELKEIINSYQDHNELVRDLNWSDKDGSNLVYALVWGARENYQSFKILASAYKDDYKSLVQGLEAANQSGGTCLVMATMKSSKEEALDLVLAAYNGMFTQKLEFKTPHQIQRRYRKALLNAFRKPQVKSSNITHLAIQRDRPERLIKIIMAYGNNWKALLEDLNATGETGNALTAAVGYAAQVNIEYAKYRRNTHSLEIIFNVLKNIDGICKNDEDWAWFINSVNELLFNRFSMGPIIDDQGESKQIELFKKARGSINPDKKPWEANPLDHWKEQLKNVKCNALEVARVLECEKVIDFLKSMYAYFGHTIPDQSTGNYTLPYIPPKYTYDHMLHTFKQEI